MNAVFKEFDIINKDNIGEQHFNELLQFAKTQTVNEESDSIMRFIQICYSANNTFIKTKNYVGLIQLPSGYQIEILPKIYGSDNEYDIREVVVKMLRSLPMFQGKKLGRANLNTSKMTLYELFINMYLKDVLTLVKRGLKSSYVNLEGNLNFLKGKLLFNKHIRYNLAHKDRFYVEFDEYSLNRPEHKLIKAALLKLQHKAKIIENRQLIYKLLAIFDFAEVSTNYAKDFATININRQNKEYEQVMIWTELFLRNKSFTPFAGQTETQALLFSMHDLFELYIAEQIINRFKEWNITKQASNKYLFDSPTAFKLKPDILLENNGKKIIMDTKWKQLYNNPTYNYGIKEDDMYQMYVYAKRYNIDDIFILYPAIENLKNQIAIYKSDNLKIKIFLVDLFNIDDSMTELYNLIK